MLDPKLSARRVLIVEDEPLIAMNLEDMLTDLGYHVVAIATKISEALSLAENMEFDVGILDINLAGFKSFPVADILLKRGISFVFTSGYGADGLIDNHRGAYLLTKPISEKSLNDKIVQALKAPLS